jgi:hypothetical protein
MVRKTTSFGHARKQVNKAANPSDAPSPTAAARRARQEAAAMKRFKALLAKHRGKLSFAAIDL